MAENAARYLGFAFASADLLFEIDPEGKVVFVMGAVQRVLGLDQAQALGRPWRDLIAGPDQDLVAALIDSLSSADRRGPVRVELEPKSNRPLRRFAAFSACRLPQVSPNVSCVLALGLTFGESEDRVARAADGLHDLDGFLASTMQLLESARAAGLDLSLDLIELSGLKDASSESEDPQTVLRRVAVALRAESVRGEGAARLGDEQFALIRNRADKPDHLPTRIEKAAASAGATIVAKAASVILAPEASPLHTMRALRFALESFLKDGPATADTTFQSVLENTVTQANAFSAVVKERRFGLVYQPVVELASGALGHFEVLVRLDGDKSPAEAIQMAEELELIESLDFAVVERVVKKIKADRTGRLRLAANVSARSLMRHSFISNLLKLITVDPGLSDQLLFEFTETASITDLDVANTSIQRLRQHGFGVCLDDFNAGAASLSYLRSLSVDFVKIDGQYMREVAESRRDSAVIRHLVKLCDELGVATIAEMIETPDVAEAVSGLGIRYGQGWRFGRPSPEPIYERPNPPKARRMGAVESWG